MDLLNLKYNDLQKLAKSYGLKANLKTSLLVDSIKTAMEDNTNLIPQKIDSLEISDMINSTESSDKKRINRRMTSATVSNMENNEEKENLSDGGSKSKRKNTSDWNFISKDKLFLSSEKTNSKNSPKSCSVNLGNSETIVTSELTRNNNRLTYSKEKPCIIKLQENTDNNQLTKQTINDMELGKVKNKTPKAVKCLRKLTRSSERQFLKTTNRNAASNSMERMLRKTLKWVNNDIGVIENNESLVNEIHKASMNISNKKKQLSKQQISTPKDMKPPNSKSSKSQVIQWLRNNDDREIKVTSENKNNCSFSEICENYFGKNGGSGEKLVCLRSREVLIFDISPISTGKTKSKSRSVSLDEKENNLNNSTNIENSNKRSKKMKLSDKKEVGNKIKSGKKKLSMNGSSYKNSVSDNKSNRLNRSKNSSGKNMVEKLSNSKSFNSNNNNIVTELNESNIVKHNKDNKGIDSLKGTYAQIFVNNIDGKKVPLSKNIKENLIVNDNNKQFNGSMIKRVTTKKNNNKNTYLEINDLSKYVSNIPKFIVSSSSSDDNTGLKSIQLNNNHIDKCIAMKIESNKNNNFKFKCSTLKPIDYNNEFDNKSLIYVKNNEYEKALKYPNSNNLGNDSKVVNKNTDDNNAEKPASKRFKGGSEVKLTVPSEIKIPRVKAKDWAKIHQKQFDKMDSIDVYMEKKVNRMAKWSTPKGANKSMIKSLIKVKLSSSKKKKMGQHQPINVKPFVPEALSTKKMNIQFSKIPVLKFNGGRKENAVELTEPSINGDEKLATGSTASVQQGAKIWPLKSSNFDNIIPDAANQQMKNLVIPLSNYNFKPGYKFDLAASLEKPLTWIPYVGKIKPLGEINNQYNGGSNHMVDVKNRVPISKEQRLENKLKEQKKKRFDLNMVKRQIN